MNNCYLSRVLSVIAITTAIIGVAASPILMQPQLVSSRVVSNYAHLRVPIAVSGDNVYVTWWDNKTGNNEVFFARSTDNGQTFEEVVNLSNATGASADNEISAEGDNVYVTWWDNKTGNWEVFSRASADNGETFEDAVMLNSIANASFKLAPPPPNTVAVDSLVDSSGDNQYVVWWDNKTGNFEVSFARSTDNGETFDDTVNISNSSDANSMGARIDAEGDNVYITWFDIIPGQKNAFIKVSNDNGETFGNPILLNSTTTTT
jgi:hypothetical protein